MKVVLADFNIEGADKAAKELNASSQVALAVKVDVGDWESQKRAFETAVQAFGRINYVFPIAGITERPWLPFNPSDEGFVRPDLSVMNVNATGALYTCALGVQHFHRQRPDKYGFRGKGETQITSLTSSWLNIWYSYYCGFCMWLLLRSQSPCLHSFETVRIPFHNNGLTFTLPMLN
jgi:NAD(P)-dependent dehydrogenase (short-subunit alcohol dehydrogenase family)